MRTIGVFLVFWLVSCTTTPLPIEPSLSPSPSPIATITPTPTPALLVIKPVEQNKVEQVKNFAEVDTGIYRSGRPLPSDFKMLATTYKIKNVISLETYWIEKKTLAAEKAAVKAAGMTFYSIPIAPVGEFDAKKVMQAYQLLHTIERPILVHCFRGSERTGVVVATYRILENKWPYKAVFEEMDKYGFSPLFKNWKHELEEMIENK